MRALAVCVTLLVPAALDAQSLDGGADWGYGASSYGTGGDRTTTSTFTQGYTVGYRSSLWDPRFLIYAGELTFNKNALTFGQEAGASHQTGFKTTAHLFQSRPLRASVHASRSFGSESANYPVSSGVRGGLALPAGAAPELKSARSEFGVSWQLAAKSLPRVEFSYQDSGATLAAGSLEALQRQRSLQALVVRPGPRVSNTLRYQRSEFDTSLSHAFRQEYGELGYELVAKATDRTWGTVRAGRRTTYSLFEVPAQFTEAGVEAYRPPPGGAVGLYYATATLAHQATAKLATEMSVGFDREGSAAGATSALLAAATTRYHPLAAITLHGGGTYGQRGQETDEARMVVLTRGFVAGTEYRQAVRFLHADAAYEVGRGWNTNDRGVDGASRLWRARANAATDVLRFVHLTAGHDRGRSVDDLLSFGNQWQERTHASARSMLTRRVAADISYVIATIDRGVAPQLFRTRYTQASTTASFDLVRQRRVAFTAGRFVNRSFGGDDTSQYVGGAFDGRLIGRLHVVLTARRERTVSAAAHLDQDGYYTSSVMEYRVRLFTFSLEHRYTDLALSTAAQMDPLTFKGNQILVRVGRRFGFAR